MLSFLLGFLMILVLACCVSIVYDLSAARTFMASLLAVCMLLYILAIFGLTNIAYYITAIASVAALVYCIKHWQKFFALLSSTTVIVLFAATLLSVAVLPWLSSNDPEVVNYWLPGLQYLKQTNAMPYAADILPQDILHPPLIWFLQYFLLYHVDYVDVGVVFCANNMLAFACFLPIFDLDRPKDRRDVITIAVEMILVASLLGIDSGYSTLSPGRLFAILYAYGLFLAIFCSVDKPFAVTEISLIISGVCLLNSTGFAFAFLILFVARVNTFFSTKGRGFFYRIFGAARRHMMATVSLATATSTFVAVLFLGGNTSARAAVSSVFSALFDFVNWTPYTVTVLALLLLPRLLRGKELSH